jgi:hypothetical protein
MGMAIVRCHRPRPPGVSEYAHQEDEAALGPRSFASGWAASPAGGGRARAPPRLHTRQWAGAVGADVEQSAATAPMRLRPAA